MARDETPHSAARKKDTILWDLSSSSSSHPPLNLAAAPSHQDRWATLEAVSVLICITPGRHLFHRAPNSLPPPSSQIHLKINRETMRGDIGHWIAWRNCECVVSEKCSYTLTHTHTHTQGHTQGHTHADTWAAGGGATTINAEEGERRRKGEAGAE